MKSKKPSMITIVSLALLAAEAAWFYFSREKELPAPVQVISESELDKSTEYRPSSNVENAPVINRAPPVKFSDATGYFDLNGLTVSQYVNKYREAVDKGDKMAAFNIYRAETICARIPELQQSLGAMRYSQDVKAKDAKQLSLKEAQSVCIGFKDNPKERREYLLIAAKSGITAAQVAYASNPPEEINLAYQRDRTDPRVVQWQKEAVGFLTQAANRGDPVALKELAAIYDAGKMAPQDRQLALTYRMALALLNNSSFNPDISRLSGQMTSDQVKAAYAAATALVNSCCDKF